MSGRQDAGELRLEKGAGVRPQATLWDVDLSFGRLREPLQDFRVLPFIDYARLTSELNPLSPLVCLSFNGGGLG